MSTEPPAPSLQQRLEQAASGRFHVIRELGRGGMAQVFLVRDRERDDPVAVKVLFPEVALLLGAERFHQEIGFLRRLHHPGIVPLLDSHESGALLYYTMPFLQAESLGERLTREGPLPVPVALRITAEVGRAVDYAHGENVVHRDIKPENILLTPAGAVVCDFGVARAIERAGGERISSSGFLIGTPAYMSPEQARGGPVDARCDVYALGCVLHEMLTGEPPFSGTTPQALLSRQISEAPRGVRTLQPSLPPEVEAAVLAALAKDPARRPASASALLRMLAPQGV